LFTESGDRDKAILHFYRAILRDSPGNVTEPIEPNENKLQR
jgi:hypothetical protein